MNSLSLRKAVQAELQTKLLSNNAIEQTVTCILVDGFYYAGGLSGTACKFTDDQEDAVAYEDEDKNELKWAAQHLQEKYPTREITFEHHCSIYVTVKEPFVQIHKMGEN